MCLSGDRRICGGSNFFYLTANLSIKSPGHLAFIFCPIASCAEGLHYHDKSMSYKRGTRDDFLPYQNLLCNFSDLLEVLKDKKNV